MFCFDTFTHAHANVHTHTLTNTTHTHADRRRQRHAPTDRPTDRLGVISIHIHHKDRRESHAATSASAARVALLHALSVEIIQTARTNFVRCVCVHLSALGVLCRTPFETNIMRACIELARAAL